MRISNQSEFKVEKKLKAKQNLQMTNDQLLMTLFNDVKL
jgi:hypothetical protein